MGATSEVPIRRRSRRPPARPARWVRRTGYLAAATANGVLLLLLHGWPGWEVVPFLTASFADVLWLVDLALWAGIVGNVVYAVRDPRWLTALGGLVTTVLGLAATVLLWDVFPFDLSGGWTVLARAVLGVAVLGSVVGLMVGAVQLVRALAAVRG